MLLNFTLGAFIPYALHFLPCGLCFVLQTLHALPLFYSSLGTQWYEREYFFFLFFFFYVLNNFSRTLTSTDLIRFFGKLFLTRDIVNVILCTFIRNLSNGPGSKVSIYILNFCEMKKTCTWKTSFVKGVPRENTSLVK